MKISNGAFDDSFSPNQKLRLKFSNGAFDYNFPRSKVAFETRQDLSTRLTLAKIYGVALFKKCFQQYTDGKPSKFANAVKKEVTIRQERERAERELAARAAAAREAEAGAARGILGRMLG